MEIPKANNSSNPEKPMSSSSLDRSPFTNEFEETMGLFKDSSHADGEKLHKPCLEGESVDKVVSAKTWQKLKDGEFIKLNEQVRVYYDKEYNAVRFNVGTHETINLWLKADKTHIDKLVDANAQSVNAGLLSQIIEAGGLQPEVITKLGLSKTDIEQSQRQAKEDQAILSRLTADNLNRLPDSSKYIGNATNTINVLQGNAQIIDVAKNPDTNGLYTYGAGPCSVLILTSKDDSGAAKKIAMAHIDAGVTSTGINSLIGQMEGKHLSAHVISGDQDTALMIGKTLRDRDVPIDFANVDQDGSRSDAVAIDKNGIVYYGSIPELNYADDKEMQALVMQRTIASMSKGLVGIGGLTIKRR